MLKKVPVLPFAIAVISGAYLMFLGIHAWCGPLALGTSVWMNEEAISDGYVLVAPYYGDTNFAEPGAVHLMDSWGRIVHSWQTKYTTLISYLQPSGTIYAAMTPPLDIKDFPSGGSTGLIQEIDWDGNVLWEIEDRRMTHDFEVMPDGGVAYVRWNLAPQSFAQNVQGGMRVASTSVWTNEIVVVNRAKEVTWTWKPEDHLDPREFELSPLVPRTDWMHINSIRYLEKNPLTQTPVFLITARHLSRALMIEIETGNVLWMSPKDTVALPHDATLTDSGTILMFDNGLFRNVALPVVMSGAVEIESRLNSIAWNWNGGPSMIEKMQFSAHFMSGAQRLQNGNTLITASSLNTILEVTPEGDVVWKYTNDWRDESGRMHIVFKARKYDARDTEWGSRISRFSMGGFCPR